MSDLPSMPTMSEIENFLHRPRIFAAQRPEDAGLAEIMNSMHAASRVRYDNPPTQGREQTNWRGLPAKELFQAVHAGDIIELKRLLARPELKLRVNDLDGNGGSLLHIFPFCGKYNTDDDADAIVQVLVAAGIDINIKRTITEETVLHQAIVYKKVHAVKALLKHGARTDTSNWRGHMPIPTAEAVCQHDGEGNRKCCQVLKLLLDAEETHRSKLAEALRLEGNQNFAKGEFVRAWEFYTQSLKLHEDPRTFANRAQCSINIAKQDFIDMEQDFIDMDCLKVYPTYILMCGKDAVFDAEKAIALDSSFAKAHYRLVLGHLLQQNASRAHHAALEALKECPDNMKLQELEESLVNFKSDQEVDGAILREIIITA